MNKGKKFFAILTFFALMLFVSSTAMAEESYQSEVSLGYMSSEDDSDYESKTYALTGNIHFSKVDTTGHPLAEAAFMERVGSIQFTLWDIENESNSFEGEGNYLFLDGSYLKQGFPLAFYGRVLQGSFELKDKLSPSKSDVDITMYDLGLGWFIIDGFEVELHYEKWKYDYSNFPQEPELERTTIFTKFVHELSGQMAFNLEVFATKEEDDPDNPFFETEKSERYTLGGDFYFTPKISLGGAFSRETGDDKDYEGDTKSLRFNIFITPKIALGIGASIFDAENSVGDDKETFDTNFKVRF